MYHVPDVGRLLTAILPELTARAVAEKAAVPLDLGLTVGDRRWLIHVADAGARIEPERLSRRHLGLSPAALVRLVFGHTGIDRALAEDDVEASTATAVDVARILFPVRPIWRSPLDSATA
jgi:hypothetical protein